MLFYLVINSKASRVPSVATDIRVNSKFILIKSLYCIWRKSFWVFSLRILIPLCRFQYKNYQYVLSLVFAIEEINRNPHILPNMSLEFDLYNALPSEQRTLESSLIWLSGLGKDIPNYDCRRESKSLAVLTGTTWAISAQIGTLLELYKFPQVRLRGRGRDETMYPLVPFSGA